MFPQFRLFVRILHSVPKLTVFGNLKKVYILSIRSERIGTGGIQKLKKYIYDVTLETELGIRRGKLIRHVEPGQSCERGYIRILEEMNPYIAAISPTGKCDLTVTLKTFMSHHEFSGSGYFYPDKIELKLRNSRTSCVLKGEIAEVISCDV